jgi:hypothetical protein
MAATKTVVRNNINKCLIRIVGTTAGDTSTVDLDVDCLGSFEALTVGGTVAINIAKVKASTGNSITLVRNGVTVAALYGSDVLDEADWVITDQNTHDIAVTFVSGAGMVLLELTKVSGFSPEFEPGSFGGGDNINAVGS